VCRDGKELHGDDCWCRGQRKDRPKEGVVGPVLIIESLIVDGGVDSTRDSGRWGSEGGRERREPRKKGGKKGGVNDQLRGKKPTVASTEDNSHIHDEIYIFGDVFQEAVGEVAEEGEDEEKSELVVARSPNLVSPQRLTSIQILPDHCREGETDELTRQL